ARGGVDAPPLPRQPAPAPVTAITATRRLGRSKAVSAVSVQAAAKRVTSPADSSIAFPQRELTWGRRLRWVGLSAAPVSLMLGVTTYLTTDIAAIPFIWIIPLALYLLTF